MTCMCLHSGAAWCARLLQLGHHTRSATPHSGRPLSPRRPGILCLINDVDWELEGKAEAELHDGDVIALVSTLHGG